MGRVWVYILKVLVHSIRILDERVWGLHWKTERAGPFFAAEAARSGSCPTSCLPAPSGCPVDLHGVAEEEAGESCDGSGRHNLRGGGEVAEVAEGC